MSRLLMCAISGVQTPRLLALSYPVIHWSAGMFRGLILGSLVSAQSLTAQVAVQAARERAL